MTSSVVSLVEGLISYIDSNMSTSNKSILCDKPLDAEQEIQRVIDAGLKEDLSNRGDISTLSSIPLTAMSEAYLLAKADGIITLSTQQ